MVTGTIGTRPVFRCDLPQVPLDLLYHALRSYGNSVAKLLKLHWLRGVNFRNMNTEIKGIVRYDKAVDV